MRDQREQTAKLRRALPQGPAVDDYMMYGPAWDEACPMCRMWLDGLNGVAHHIVQRVPFVVVAKADAG